MYLSLLIRSAQLTLLHSPKVSVLCLPVYWTLEGCQITAGKGGLSELSYREKGWNDFSAFAVKLKDELLHSAYSY